jgi:hypothetical protein
MNKQRLRLEPPPDYLQTPLIQLRSYYKELVEEYTRLAAQAREQLVHVEALMEGWQASQMVREINVSVIAPANPNSTALQSVIPDILAASRLDARDLNKIPADSNTPELKMTPEVQLGSQERDLSLSDAMSDAIADLLQNHQGTVLHIDFIIRELYGRLEEKEFKIALIKVNQVLQAGVDEMRWLAVPDEPDCYSFDNSYEPEETEETVADAVTFSPDLREAPFHCTRLRGLKVKEQYRHASSLSEAIKLALQHKKPNSLNATQVLQVLFPEEQIQNLGTLGLKAALEAVSNALTKGHNKNWRRVKLGYYKAVD